MRSLWWRWIRLVAAGMVLAALFIRLGEWQMHRHEGREQSNAIVRANEAAPVTDFPAMFSMTRTIENGDEWQRIRVTGTYDAAHQFQAMERSINDRGGTEIVTPMHTAHGNVLISRGFLPRPNGQNDPTVLPAPPSGTVTVIGYVRRDAHGHPNQVTPVNHRMRLINAPAIGQQLPYPIVDGYLQLVSSDPAQSGGLVPMGLPELSGGPFLSYSIQWFMFTAIGVVGIGMLIRGDLREYHKRRRAKAAGPDPTESDDEAEPAEPGVEQADDEQPSNEDAVPDGATPLVDAEKGSNDATGTH